MHSPVGDPSNSRAERIAAAIRRGVALVGDGVTLFLTLNVWLAVASVLMVAVTALTLDVPLQRLGWGIYLPVFVVYFAYVRDRRAVSQEDWLNHPRRSRLVATYERPLHATELLSLLAYEGLLLALLPVGTVTGVLWLGVAHLPIAVLACYPALKGTPVLDSLAVTAAWSSLIVSTVVVVAAVQPSGTVLVVGLAWLLIVFAGVESRNVDDAAGDAAVGRGTLASRLGPTRTGAIVLGLKTAGVVLFWATGGAAAVLFVGLYLGFLRVARSVSREVGYDSDPM